MVMQELKRLSAFIDYRRKGNEALSDQFVAARAFFLEAATSEAHPDSVRAGQFDPPRASSTGRRADPSYALLKLAGAVRRSTKTVNRLVLMSGHDSVDLWRAYPCGHPGSQAKKFWQIMPPTRAERKIIPLAAQP
jgi:hypothetical protein